MERLQEITENKRLRKELDEKIQEVKNLPPSRERSLAITKLQEAVMWLGMDLKRLNDTAEKYHNEGYDLDREKSTDRLLVFVKSEEVKGKFID